MGVIDIRAMGSPRFRLGNQGTGMRDSPGSQQQSQARDWAFLVLDPALSHTGLPWSGLCSSRAPCGQHLANAYAILSAPCPNRRRCSLFSSAFSPPRPLPTEDFRGQVPLYLRLMNCFIPLVSPLAYELPEGTEAVLSLLSADGMWWG